MGPIPGLGLRSRLSQSANLRTPIDGRSLIVHPAVQVIRTAVQHRIDRACVSNAQILSLSPLPVSEGLILPRVKLLYDYSSVETARAALEKIYALNLCSWTPAPDSISTHSFFVKLEDKAQKARSTEKSSDYYANVGDAIRTLREDIPLMFVKDLNYDIYEENIVFRDPQNSLQGIKKYSLLFWSLRFHGKLFFKSLYVEVRRIWQPEETVIKMRWTVYAVPRVPWEAEGSFDGISTYKLSSSGKVYEHSVDNILLRDPPVVPPLLAGINLVPSVQQQPCPGGWMTSETRGLRPSA